MRTATLASVVIVGAAVLLLGTFSGFAGGQALPGRQMPEEGREHVPEGTPISYRNSPPTSGPHYLRTVRWEVYDVPVPEGYWVHNLEHGDVVILYYCPQGCPELVSQLKELFRSLAKGKPEALKLVVTPYPNLKTRLAVLAWNWIDELEEFDRERLLRFYQAHVGQGPE